MARIKRDGLGLRDQMTQAIAGITAAGPGSLKLDWEAIEGASYEMQWSDLATRVAPV